MNKLGERCEVSVRNLPASGFRRGDSAKLRSAPNRRLRIRGERAAGGFIEGAERHDPPSAGDVGLNMLKSSFIHRREASGGRGRENQSAGRALTQVGPFQVGAPAAEENAPIIHI